MSYPIPVAIPPNKIIRRVKLVQNEGREDEMTLAIWVPAFPGIFTADVTTLSIEIDDLEVTA